MWPPGDRPPAACRGQYGDVVSYDLTLYAPRALDGAELREFISAQNSLDIDAFDGESRWIAVARGAKRKYCFTIDGPFQLEAEDVPEDVTAAVLGVSHMYTVTVEGSAEAEIPHAVRFARTLAQSLGGAVQDQQLDDVWARGASRTATRPQRGDRVNIIRMEWYTRKTKLGDDFGHVYASLCRRLLPEALPRRFGEFEPFQGRLDERGDEGFAQAWRDATTLLFFTATSPCISGHLSAGPNERFPNPIWTMSITAHHEPLNDANWREAVRRFFVSIAEQVDAFYASAEVVRGNIWNGRSLSVDGNSEWPISPARREGWMGLPPYPVWSAWYGGPYRELIPQALPHGRLEPTEYGVLHELSDAPSDRDQLTGLVTVRRGFRRRTEWVPGELLAQVQPSDGRVQPVPLRPAVHVPNDLRR